MVGVRNWGGRGGEGGDERGLIINIIYTYHRWKFTVFSFDIRLLVVRVSLLRLVLLRKI